jgi:hypothetical protein
MKLIKKPHQFIADAAFTLVFLTLIHHTQVAKHGVNYQFRSAYN